MPVCRPCGACVVVWGDAAGTSRGLDAHLPIVG